jgi:hypothetical protein
MPPAGLSHVPRMHRQRFLASQCNTVIHHPPSLVRQLNFQ